MSDQAKKKQRRGIRFPTHPLSEALNVARVVHEQGGGRLSQESVALGLHLSVTSSSFVARVASAKHFGLIVEEDDLLKTTSLATKILRPTDPEEEKEGLIAAFRSFDVFKKVYERYEGEKLPDRPLLENILHREYGVSDVSKGTAYDVFIESAKFAMLVSETEQGLVCGKEKKIKEGKEQGLPPKPTLIVNEKLVEFLENVGALRIVFDLHEKTNEETFRREIEKTSTSLLERCLLLATELSLSASRMSLKIASERLKADSFQDARQYIIYVEEGIREDLKLKPGE